MKEAWYTIYAHELETGLSTEWKVIKLPFHNEMLCLVSACLGLLEVGQKTFEFSFDFKIID